MHQGRLADVLDLVRAEAEGLGDGKGVVRRVTGMAAEVGDAGLKAADEVADALDKHLDGLLGEAVEAPAKAVGGFGPGLAFGGRLGGHRTPDLGAVAAGGLGGLEGLVGLAEQVVGGFAGGRVGLGHAGAQSDLDRLAAACQGRLGHVSADAFDHAEGFGHCRVGHQQEELIAAVSRDGVGGPGAVADILGDPLEDLVAEGMPPGVVDHLEVVHIEHGQHGGGWRIGGCVRTRR